MWSIPTDVLQRVVESLLWFFLCWICSRLIPGLAFYQSLRFLWQCDSDTSRRETRGSASTSSWTWLCFVTPPLLQVLTWKLSQHAFLQPDTRPQPPGQPFKSRRSLSLMSECFLTRPNCSRLSAWSGFPASSAVCWDSSNQETGLFVFSIWLTHI